MNKTELQELCDEKGIEWRDSLTKKELSLLLGDGDDGLTKLELRIKRKHPTGKYRLGDYVIGRRFNSFALSDDEVKLLETKEYKHWIAVKK